MSPPTSSPYTRLGPLLALERRHAEIDFDALRRRVLAEEPEAWRIFVERYSRTVYTVALKLASDAREREEIAQHVYLEVFEHLAEARYKLLRGFRGDSRFETYLFVIVRNAVRRRRSLEAAERGRSVPLIDDGPDDAAGVSTDARQSAGGFAERVGLDPPRVASILERALAELHPRERLALCLRFRERVPLRELAEIFGWKDTNEAAHEICKILRKLDVIGRCRRTLRWGEPEREVLLRVLEEWLESPPFPHGEPAPSTQGGTRR